MPTAATPSLTFILPVYNGARFFGDTLQKAWHWLGERDGERELLVVDDGSNDATAEVIAAFAASAQQQPGRRFTAVRNTQNRGKGFSLRRAFLLAQGEHVVFTDADLTYAMHNAEPLLAALTNGAQVAYGSRMHDDSRYVVAPTFFPKLYTRHAMGRVFNLLVRALVVPRIRDTQAGLKGFTRAAARELAGRIRLDRFSFDVELFYIARRLGMRIDECPVEFLYRKEPSTVRFVQDSLRMVRDMLRIRWRGLRKVYDQADPALLADLERGGALPGMPAPTPVQAPASKNVRELGG